LKLDTIVAPGASVVAVVLLMGPALFDTTLVVISRVRTGRHIYVGGTDHTSHRFMRMGLSPTATTLVLVAGTAYSCGMGVAVTRNTLPATIAATATVIPALVALVGLLRVPVYVSEDVEFARDVEPATSVAR
jgi:UDP-GlcNAc:undecaprenyl-phosphate GlcNAc-1-phosphate transferase